MSHCPWGWLGGGQEIGKPPQKNGPPPHLGLGLGGAAGGGREAVVDGGGPSPLAFLCALRPQHCSPHPKNKWGGGELREGEGMEGQRWGAGGCIGLAAPVTPPRAMCKTPYSPRCRWGAWRSSPGPICPPQNGPVHVGSGSSPSFSLSTNLGGPSLGSKDTWGSGRIAVPCLSFPHRGVRGWHWAGNSSFSAHLDPKVPQCPPQNP